MKHIEAVDVFKIFLYLKHLIEGKCSVPFDKETTNHEAYRCPIGYASYHDSYDREQFDKLEELDGVKISQKDEEKEKILVYHTNVRIATITSRFLIDIDARLSSGQVSVSRRVFDELFGVDDKIGFMQRKLDDMKSGVVINVRDTVSKTNIDIETVIDSESIYEHKLIVKEKEVTFYLDDDLFSISVLIYPQFNCVSFLEGSIKSNNLDSNLWVDQELFNEIDKVFRFEVPQILLSEWFDELSQEEREKLKIKVKQRFKKKKK